MLCNKNICIFCFLCITHVVCIVFVYAYKHVYALFCIKTFLCIKQLFMRNRFFIKLMLCIQNVFIRNMIMHIFLSSTCWLQPGGKPFANVSAIALNNTCSDKVSTPSKSTYCAAKLASMKSCCLQDLSLSRMRPSGH